jgi:hypothetical protein
MRKAFLFLGILLLLSSCGTYVGSVGEESLMQTIVAGDSKAKVLQILGQPGKIIKSNAELEEWHYCSTGFTSDTFYTIILNNEIVTEKNQKTVHGLRGVCVDAFTIPTQEEVIQANIQADAGKCTAYGLEKGTTAYADCMMKLEQNRQRNQQAEIMKQGLERSALINAYIGSQESQYQAPAYSASPQNNDTINCTTFGNQTSCRQHPSFQIDTSVYDKIQGIH